MMNKNEIKKELLNKLIVLNKIKEVKSLNN